MGVFEEVFAKRGGEDAADRPSTGAFEEVFVRRGRWRKTLASSDPSGDDIVHLAEHVAAELPDINEHAPSLLDFTSKCPIAEEGPSVSDVTEALQCVVKNTFLTTEGLDYDSLKDFLLERKIQSCPATSFVIDDLATKDDMVYTDTLPKECIFKTASSLGEFGTDLGGCVPRGCSINTVSTLMDLDLYGGLQSIAEMVPESPRLVPDSTDMFMVPSSPEFEGVPPPPVGVAPAPPAMLRLAEAIAPPELGSKELPSMGSMLHHKGECKPCTFFHTRGCENKEDCQFCHLCGPNEKKKRLKVAKRVQREAVFAALESAKATLASWTAAEESDYCNMVIE
jgi:hypothetical protein